MRLKNCCNFIDYRGKTPEKAKSGYRFITAKNIGINGFHDEPMEFIPKENYERVMVRGIPSEGDILFTTEAPMGHVGVIPHFDEPFAVGQRIIVIQPNNELLNSSYLVHLLRSRNFQDKVSGRSSGSTVTGIRSKELVEIDIKFPNLVEQHKIAEVLDQLSAVISKRTAELQLYDELIKARFVEMFGDPIVNPKGWDIKKIGELATDVRYGTSSPAVEGGRYPYLRMNNLTFDGQIDLTDLKYIDIPDAEIEKCVVRRGDVLFNRTNSVELVGKTAVFDYPQEMVIAGYIIRVRLNNELLPEILSQYMNLEALKNFLRSMAKGAVNQANINAQELQSIKVYVPDRALQEQFVDMKKQVDKSKVVIQKSLEETKLLFDSLMQRYFG